MGVFDVSLQIAYGGGDRAFCRLIEAIMRAGDPSILNWKGEPAGHPSSHAIPLSPESFVSAQANSIPYPMAFSQKLFSFSYPGPVAVPIFISSYVGSPSSSHRSLLAPAMRQRDKMMQHGHESPLHGGQEMFRRWCFKDGTDTVQYQYNLYSSLPSMSVLVVRPKVQMTIEARVGPPVCTRRYLDHTPPTDASSRRCTIITPDCNVSTLSNLTTALLGPESLQITPYAF
ncbi:hypothetical protein EV702DRAFT_1048311 [Suillus placidus]|uniref:Uncharacterized protein n=1 Tax=Suillus placidus TaxID=48579 RepID=A0A9P6ZNJ2_9AGAM|nr:hypothetical protein EV702DRAFT_1048311 [Suillus placidus]